MKKTFTFLDRKLNTNTLMLAIALSTTCSYSYANSKHSTYFGTDVVYNNTQFKENYGVNIFSKRPAPGLNLFAGHMFGENFGAELGFEFYKKMQRTETITSGNTAAGRFINPAYIDFVSYNTTFTQRHPYIGAIAKTAILGSNNYISLLLGVSVSHINAKYTQFRDNFGSRDDVRTFSKTKPIGIIKATFEHKFNERFALKVSTAWRNTAKFKIKSQEDSANSAEVRLKNSFNLGAGATYYIY